MNRIVFLAMWTFPPYSTHKTSLLSSMDALEAFMEERDVTFNASWSSFDGVEDTKSVRQELRRPKVLPRSRGIEVVSAYDVQEEAPVECRIKEASILNWLMLTTLSFLAKFNAAVKPYTYPLNGNSSRFIAVTATIGNPVSKPAREKKRKSSLSATTHLEFKHKNLATGYSQSSNEKNNEENSADGDAFGIRGRQHQ